MFTGLVQACGQVASTDKRSFGTRLVVDRSGWGGYSPNEGDSVCVSGVCLTVVEFDQQTLAFDVVAETLSRTTLGHVQPGSRVNLEPSLLPTTPLGGHFVQGHVDGVGQITNVRGGEDEYRVTIQPSHGDLMEAIIPKGSVAVDGVSLTVAAVGRPIENSQRLSDFEVALIPTTLECTTLGDWREGDTVNIETDIISKTVVHWLRNQTPNKRIVTLETLRGAGFVDG